MSWKAADVERIHKKLQMEQREGRDRLAWFVYGGKRVLFTRMSHQRGDVAGRIVDFIRQQLKVNESQLRGLRDCSVTYEDYTAILKAKGVI
jgi:hypothetical protein